MNEHKNPRDVKVGDRIITEEGESIKITDEVVIYGTDFCTVAYPLDSTVEVAAVTVAYTICRCDYCQAKREEWARKQPSMIEELNSEDGENNSDIP